MNYHPLLTHLCVESFIKHRENDYYEILQKCDQAGNSTLFIEFSLETILQAIDSLYNFSSFQNKTASDRLKHAKNYFGCNKFSRKDYLTLIKTISSATDSRDLASGVANKILNKHGDKGTTLYEFV